MNRKITAFLFALFAVAAVLSVVAYYLLGGLLMERIKADALTHIALVEEVLLIDDADYREVAQRCARATGCRITFLAGDGVLLADSELSHINFPSFFYDKEMILAREGEVGSAVFVSPGTGKSTLNMAKPAVGRNGEGIIIRLAYDLTDYDSTMAFAGRVGAVIFTAGVLLSLFCFRVYLAGTRPTTQTLTRYIGAVSSGKPIQWREDTPVGEELRALADSINRLLARNEELIKTTNRKYSHINTILESMDSGLLAVDSRNDVMLFNSQAQELAQLDKRVFFESPDRGSLGPTAQKILAGTAWVLENRRSRTMTLTVREDLILEVELSPVVNKYAPYDDFGALAVIKDVTKIKKLEALRSEFVANVSHELRTPLTLISGFVETLKSGAGLSKEERFRALEIIEIEAARLRRLISQLLSLSQIENDLMPKENHPVDLLREVDSAMAAIGTLAQGKGVVLEASLPSSVPAILGNGDWVRQVVINLCENAIKYTPAGGKVSLGVSAKGDGVQVSVKDNGVGIPKSDLPRVFERFFRVDKSRNSQEGGSGLGLSIVEQMVAEMGGTIRAKSREGKGSEFVITLPAARRENEEFN